MITNIIMNLVKDSFRVQIVNFTIQNMPNLILETLAKGSQVSRYGKTKNEHALFLRSQNNLLIETKWMSR